MLIHNFLEISATAYPDKIAVIHDTEQASYRQINTRADSLARCLSENGLGSGDRIAILLENGIDYIIAYYAILKAGAAAAPLNPSLKPDGLQYLLDDLEPVAIITNFKAERLLKAVNLGHLGLRVLIIGTPKQKWINTTFKIITLEENISNPTNPIKPPTQPTDLASIIYTSGSTGKPKGVMLSHTNIASNTQSICHYLNLSRTDIQMVVLPFFYVMGKSLLNTHIAVGGTVVINNRFMYPADVVNQMIDEQVTGFSGVPSTYAYLLNRSPLANCRDRLPALRYCSQAGGHMATSLKRALRKALPAHTQIFFMYGATEAAARLTYLDPTYFESKIESIGKPIPQISIRVIDELGDEVPDGTVGELVADGPNIMLGYWKDRQETDRVLTKEGLRTGDFGFRDADGFFFLTGRKDTLIKISGHRVNPVEIENFLMESEMLIEAAVIGLTDELSGNKLVSVVVPRDDTFKKDDLLRRCKACLPKHECPVEMIIARGLPKNASGKIDREMCVDLAKTFLPPRSPSMIF